MKPMPARAVGRVNDLRAIPFAHLLIDILHAERTGTLLIYGEPGQVQAAILFESGMPVAASIEHGQNERNLIKALIPLCAWRDGDFVFAEERDLVGPNAVVAAGPLDPLPLIAAAARGPLRDDAVQDTIADIDRNMLKLNPRIDRSRYAFTPQEQPVVACLELGAIDLDDLRREAAVPERVLRRVVYVLRLTRALTLLPAARRMVSGTITHASLPPKVVLVPPAAASEPPVPDAEDTAARGSVSGAPPAMRGERALPMRSAVGSGGYSMRDPEHGVSALGRDAQAPESSAAPRARREVAQELWVRVESLVQRREFAPALLTARNAMKLGTALPAHEALVGWLLYLHGVPGGRVHPQVWDHFDLALKRDPLCEQAHYYKALVLRRSGELDQAYTHFKRVLSINPAHIEAAREIRLHHMRVEHARQQAGFLHKLLSARASGKPGDGKR